MSHLRITGVLVNCECGMPSTLPDPIPYRIKIPCPWCGRVLFDGRPKWLRWLTAGR